MSSNIPWLNYLPGFRAETWNPTVGCTKTSPGCAHCYAEQLHTRRHTAYLAGKRMPECYSAPFTTVRCLHERLEMPLRWKAPRLIFVNSMSDLFHPAVPGEFIESVFGVMSLCGQHRFVVLTKRAELMQAFFELVSLASCQASLPFESLDLDKRIRDTSSINGAGGNAWPLPNVWLGVTAEDQQQADKRIPILLCTPAAKRLVSIEPMLGHVQLAGDGWTCFPTKAWEFDQMVDRPGLDWVIAGGETGSNARSLEPWWVGSLRDQCVSAQVPFFFKQWGANSVTHHTDRYLAGREWNETPEATR